MTQFDPHSSAPLPQPDKPKGWLSRLRAQFVAGLLPKSEIITANGKRVSYYGVWNGFDANKHGLFWTDVVSRHIDQDHITILCPFGSRRGLNRFTLYWLLNGKWDIYLTAENTEHRTDLAKASIGFRLPRNPGEFRFPYWMEHLGWPGYEVDPPNPTFGARLSIEHLSRSLNDVHGPVSRSEFEAADPKAALLTSHLRPPRDMFFRACSEAMGCRGFGRAFKPTSDPKKETLAPYLFNLCPENELAEGYVTEKIPEAFLANCVPITWCRPDDLALDFNPKAVVNLHGLSEAEITKTLKDLAQNYDRFNALRSQPLLLQPPDLAPLRNFLSTVLNDGPASANQPGAS